MLKSMTGYGRNHQIIEQREILVEIRAVNHRYFEFSARVPRAYGYLEDKLKGLIQSKVARGKIEVNVSIYNLEGKDANIEVNTPIAQGYVKALRQLKDSLSLEDDLSLSTISHLSDIFSVHKEIEDEEVIWNAVKPVAEDALEAFINMRSKEGEKLQIDLQKKMLQIEEQVSIVKEKAPQTVENYRDRLYLKLTELLESQDIDEQRILTETAIFAEKIAVDEELVRLKSHLQQFAELIEAEGAVGRKLDFLVQEINRETNTIGSKATDVDIAKVVIEIKSLVEKIREQIQNIE